MNNSDLKISYPESLPIVEKKDEIIELIENHQVIVIAGETGSGKTTQIPKFCLAAGRGKHGRIGHTQPRRLAARTVANRIAEEMNVSLGDAVGYQVRFTDKISDNTSIKLMTDGILLNELQHDKLLKQYDTLIIDEAHERSLNIDFILGYLKRLLPKRQDLKLIITSATIDVERFANHFDNAPIIEVSGRSYPIETLYFNPSEFNPENEGDMAQNILAAMQEILALERQGLGHRQGDVLVFLPGEREIREAAIALRKANLEHIEILLLYSRLSQNEQNKIFKPHALRHVVLATNVAETSITVPGIRYVIDTGVARISRYSYRSKVQRLPIEKISQASCNQRQGRCGRTAPGTCIRLYSEQEFELRPQFTEAEILRTNLAQVILQMLNLRLGEPQQFPFIDMPDNRYVRDGFKLLEEIGAVSSAWKLTALGRQINKLPIDPRLGRMIIAANRLGCVNEVLIIATGLSVQDPRERPQEKQQQSQQAHARFKEKQSDFITLLNLWNYFEELRQQLSQNQLRKRLKKEFINYLKMREWRDIHHQLCIAIKSLNLTKSNTAANPDIIHRALLSGLLSNISHKQEQREYLGARNRRYHLYPGSSLFNKPPPWMMSAELVETTKLYARINALIEPHWAIDYAKHLVRFNYSEPSWSSRTGHVMANRRTSLYGLTLIEKERVTFTKIDPETCHELFIRQALVAGGYVKRKNYIPKFWQHNQRLIADIMELEAKSRRCDILIDDEQFYQLYTAKIPSHITNSQQFEQWRKQVETNNPQHLYFDKASLMQHKASQITEAQFPQTLKLGVHHYPLDYHFEPGSDNDGVTITIPIELLNQVSEADLEWLVPGILHEKCCEILKSLPKAQRKQCVPIPDFAMEFLQNANRDESLYAQLSETLRIKRSILLSAEALRVLNLDDYYRMNIKVIDDKKSMLSCGRDLSLIKEECQQYLQKVLENHSPQQQEKTYYTSWDFGPLKAEQQFEKSGLTITAFPAIVDHLDNVAIELIDTPEKAQRLSQQGLIRLLCLSLPKQIKYLHKQLFASNQQSLLLANSGFGKEFISSLIEQIIAITFLNQELPRDKQSFEACIDNNQAQLMTHANDYQSLLLTVFELKNQISKALKKHNQLSLIHSINDIKQQLHDLFFDDFITTSFTQLKHYPRYLKALKQRLDKINHNPKEKAAIAELKSLYQPLHERLHGDIANLAHHPELHHYRWLLEEYRVSLFAQQLGTAEPVSIKRLAKAWPKIS